MLLALWYLSILLKFISKLKKLLKYKEYNYKRTFKLHQLPTQTRSRYYDTSSVHEFIFASVRSEDCTRLGSRVLGISWEAFYLNDVSHNEHFVYNTINRVYERERWTNLSSHLGIMNRNVFILETQKLQWQANENIPSYLISHLISIS